MNLDGRYALITGAARRLGRAIALALAAKGANVIIHFNRSSQAAEEVVEQAESMGVSAQAIQADLRSSEAIQGMFQTLDQAVPQLDILINSAAIMERSEIRAADREAWDRTMDLNLRAAFFCLQGAANRMRDGGAIVNISDVIGLRPWAGFPIHAISKAGIEMLTKTAALELAPHIRVNAVAPGLVLKPEEMSSERWQKIAAGSPLGVPGHAENVTRAVVHLLENEYLTGETLVVDGGFQLT